MACPTQFFAETRVTSTLSSEGCGSPSRVRFCDCQVNLLSSTLVRTCSAVETLPFDRTFEACMSQLSPSLTQVDCPNPPLLSKIQERIRRSTGSHPIISQP